MRIRTGLRIAMALWLAGWAQATPAAIITYEATSLGGITWQYDYVVTNDDLASIDWFAIFFALDVDDPLLLSPTLLSLSAPTDWDPFAYQPDPLLPSDGYADYLFLGSPSGIAQGQTLGGFSAQFDLPLGIPGAQRFEIYSLRGNPLPILATGNTTPAGPASVPEPGTLLLLSIGLAGAGLMRRRPA